MPFATRGLLRFGDVLTASCLSSCSKWTREVGWEGPLGKALISNVPLSLMGKEFSPGTRPVILALPVLAPYPHLLIIQPLQAEMLLHTARIVTRGSEGWTSLSPGPTWATGVRDRERDSRPWGTPPPTYQADPLHLDPGRAWGPLT